VNLGPILQEALSWVLTYAVHSTLLLGLAWLATHLLSGERLRAQERIWKIALVGGLFTASLQLALDVDPALGRLDLGAPEEVAAASETVRQVPGVLTGAAAGTLEPAELELSWQRMLLGVWALGGTLGLALLIFAWRRIADRLAGRRRVRRGPVLEILNRLAEQAGLRRPPRLTASHRLRSPATVGIFAPQICVPYRALFSLPPDQQEALLAHELAHILRRDPLWFLVCRVIERALFFQPLNSVAMRELQEIAEFLADDWAVQQTRKEVPLARCLTEVATWVLDLRPVIAVVPMAARSSRLAARIARLLDEKRIPQDHDRRPSALAWPAAAIFSGLLLLPGAARLGRADEQPARPASVVAPAAPSSPTVELDRLLGHLDAEVGELLREIEELRAELTERGMSAKQSRTFQRVAVSVRELRERRARLEDLLPMLDHVNTRGAPAPSAQGRLTERSPRTRPTNSNPIQEITR